jgi:hypothetical protein
MTYPKPERAQIDFFNRHGYLVVENAIPATDLDELEGWCEKILEEKETLANDWAWDARESRDQRSFRIVQSSPSFVWKDIRESAYRKWLVEFGSILMNRKLEFWYDQFLAKPPAKSVPTYWHQDEGYWGRNLDDRGITCWIPLQDVTAQNGCIARSARRISPAKKAGAAWRPTAPAANAARGLGQGWKVSPYILIDPAKTFTLADIEGPGAIQQIWMTPHAANGATHPAHLLGRPGAAVGRMPGRRFLRLRLGEIRAGLSLAVCVNPGRAFNCYWEMPFRKRAASP